MRLRCRPSACSARTAPRTSCSPRSSTRAQRRERSRRSPPCAGSRRDARAALVRELVGTRENRRHRPGRGFETLTYRFEIVSDYGAFRDLQRHRLLTCQWQRLSPDLGADVPQEVVDAGLGGEFERALDVSRTEYERLRGEGLAEEAPYALCLAYRIRYVLELDAREALHLIELRSGREGHPSYRAVALQMRDAIAAVHPSVAAAMSFVDESTEPRLERLLSEMRNEPAQPLRDGLQDGGPGVVPLYGFRVTIHVSTVSSGTARQRASHRSPRFAFETMNCRTAPTACPSRTS